VPRPTSPSTTDTRPSSGVPCIVVGVDGSGRTSYLHTLVDDEEAGILWLSGRATLGDVTDAVARGGSLVIDDAHLLEPDSVQLLHTAVRAGRVVALARRPGFPHRSLAELDDALARAGATTVTLRPRDLEGVAAVAAAVSGRGVAPGDAAGLHHRSGGLPVWVVALVRGDDPVPHDAAARVERQAALLTDTATRVAGVLAVAPELPEAAVAGAAGCTPDQLLAALTELGGCGWSIRAGDRSVVVPVVADALRSLADPAETRRVHDAIATALRQLAAPPTEIAEHLRRARASGRDAAAVFAAAGDLVRFADPLAARDHYDDAVSAGADPGTLVAARAELAALLGTSVAAAVEHTDAFSLTPLDQARIRRAEAAELAAEGRWQRAIDRYDLDDPVDRLLATPGLAGLGRHAGLGRLASASPGPPVALVHDGPTVGDRVPAALARFAEACLAALHDDASATLAAFVEAAEAVERAPLRLVLPDTPHAAGALVAMWDGDLRTAERLTTAAAATRAGGTALATRHELLQAWCRMRAGRFDTAARLRPRLLTMSTSGRDRLLAASIAAGLARRSGDIAQLRAAWEAVEPVLVRRALDLWALEPTEELLVAAARLREPRRVRAAVDELAAAVDRAGAPSHLAVMLDWLRLQTALAADDADGVQEAAGALAARQPSARRQQAQREGAAVWARVHAGRVDPHRVLMASALLAEVAMPWEASRLVGQAAITTTDAALARRLLERARELSSAEPDAATPAGAGAAASDDSSALSDRERDVGRLVLEGRTHREIGTQLYISPKTVEHHVARIRTKLGAGTRAELLAMLREVLGAG
jgi:DNA-binding CsgD family transcriptional regulator